MLPSVLTVTFFSKTDVSPSLSKVIFLASIKTLEPSKDEKKYIILERSYFQ